jgi:putative PIG3 family NAD(P)H quinone oxidoreductase
VRAIVVRDKALHIADVPSPVPGPNDVLIAVRATAVNRADLLQAAGLYPPPPGVSEVVGMECAGVVAGTSDRVMALLAGGGYAEEVAVHAGSVMRVPDALSDVEAAAIPEVFLTAFLTIFMLARAREGETVLIHGGGSGVGTAATTLCKLAGMRVIVTAGSDEKCARCLEHGADVAINYKTEDFVEKARGANVILDHIGARYLARDLDAVAVDGRIVIIGSMGGQRTAEVDVATILGKRVQIIGSTLRSRRVEEKAAIVEAFTARFGADLEAGCIRPVIHTVLPLERADEAHRLMAASEHFGKIVLSV